MRERLTRQAIARGCRRRPAMKMGPVRWTLILFGAIIGGGFQRADAQPGTGPTFGVGEKVEIKWMGTYYPAQVTKIESFAGVDMLELRFNADGRERTTKYPQSSMMIRKLSGGG